MEITREEAQAAYGMPYVPTWGADDISYGRYLYMVYDQSEGFQPAYAVVSADNPQEAAEIAEEISNGRLSDSALLVVREVRQAS